ncbi:MAG: DUF4335 domain-containing protein [Alkalinema sp. CAN_BIN05]|nr:DUF4335 domain-containing protein [Alkalinema sp. CAN_BIN05]
MTRIQRQYSLPNCTLLLDGMDDPTQTNAMDLRPIMALLLNAECRIGNGYGDMGGALVGGREFFESLVNSVSRYAQEFLSGIHLPTDKLQLVQMKRSGLDQHELSYQPSPDESNPNAKPEKLNLSTVQFFDLVEAIDQFVADTQTLPAFSLNLSPVAKKFVPRAAMGKQAVPAAIGLSGLAIAALAMFSLPIPTVKQPETLRAGVNSGLPSTLPNPAASTPPSPTINPAASPGVSPSASSDADSKKIKTDLTTPSAISDPAEIDRLKQQLKGNVMDKLKQDSKFPEPLVYRVSVGKDGQMVGYKPESDVAAKEKGQTPLPDLLLNATTDKQPEALADYRVTFQISGRVDVVPWSAETSAVSAPSTPIASTSPAPTIDSKQEITDSVALDTLQPKLYAQIDSAWQANPGFNEDLRYRVQVNREGTIVSYTSENKAARDYENEIPLPKLSQGTSGNPTADGTASFKVVFRPSGKLEINPWFGYNKP